MCKKIFLIIFATLFVFFKTNFLYSQYKTYTDRNIGLHTVDINKYSPKKYSQNYSLSQENSFGTTGYKMKNGYYGYPQRYSGYGFNYIGYLNNATLSVDDYSKITRINERFIPQIERLKNEIDYKESVMKFEGAKINPNTAIINQAFYDKLRAEIELDRLKVIQSIDIKNSLRQ